MTTPPSHGWYGPDEYPTQFPAQPTQPPRPPRGRLGLAAVVLTSLVVGGGAGIGGAAAWDTWGPDEAATQEVSDSPTLRVLDEGDASAAEGSVEAVAAAVLPSVVRIDVRGLQAAGSGSGIVLDTEGHILTNHHVVEAASEGGQIRVSFADGSTAEAEILGADPLTDTAVIRAEGVDDLTPATIGRSEHLDVGQGVVAVGSPFGLDATVTSGIVSALDRPVKVGSDGQGNSTTYPAIQTDAAINPGNSGGPLVDMDGAVVGINSSIRTASSSAGSIGLGFAIPIDQVLPIVEQMIAGETPTHAQFGIQITDTEADQGAEVRLVAADSTADDAGLQPGDIITQVDDHHITGADSLVATIRSYRPGDTVSVTWQRDGERMQADVRLDSDAD